MENHSDSTVVGPSLVPKLEVLRGDGIGTKYTLKFKTRLGRESDNDIVLSDPRSSRYHCQVTFGDGEWVLTDLGSANGTLLNGMPVSVPQSLSHGSQITIGNTILAFVDPMDEAETPIDPSSTIIGGKLPPLPQMKSAAKSASRLPLILGAAVIVLLLIAAGIFFSQRKDTPAVAEATVTKAAIVPIRTTPVNAELVLKYEEDFSDSTSGWDDAFGQSYTKQYGNSQYHIEITTENLVVWGLANRSASDFEMEVEATPQSVENGITYGIIFRYIDSNNYYRFDISDDGFFLLTKFEKGEWHTLIDWTASPAIHSGQNTNVLKVAAEGTDISLFANGQELTRVSDATFSKGNFGFFTSTFNGAHSWVSFDNLKLWAPEAQEIAMIPTVTPTPLVENTQADELPTPTENNASAENTPTTEEATPAPLIETQSVTDTAEIPPTVIPPTPLPDFVTHDQPLARGENRLPGSIIFPLYDSARGTYDIFIAKTDGSERELLFSDASQPAADSTGKTIAYRSWKADARGLISQIPGESDRWLFENFFESASPTFSPNNDFFVFHSRAGRDSPALYRTLGTERDVLRREGNPIEGEMAAFSPDGWLAYRGCLNGNCGIIRTNLDGGNPMVLSDNGNDTAPAVSPNGKSVAFMSLQDGNWEIYSVGADGQNLKRLTTADGNDGLPVWSPNGKNIAFASNRDGEWAIWVMTADGANTHQLFKLNGSIDGIAQVDTAHSFGWLEEHIVWVK